MPELLLNVRDLAKYFPLRGGLLGRARQWVRAVDGVDLQLPRAASLALVGESGCGKTTLGRCILRLQEPDRGSIQLAGQDLLRARGANLRALRRRAQMVFQDPYGSLNPRLSVAEALCEPAQVHEGLSRDQAEQRACELLRLVGLPTDALRRYPHQFSGGQRQRIGIARALSLNPDLLILDEAVSALDVSVQAQVLNLLMDIQEARGCAYVMISHDLAVVAQLCDAVAVMYLGEIVEEGSVQAVFTRPLHPYTQALLAAVPSGMVGQAPPPPVLAGEPPSPLEPPSPERILARFPGWDDAFRGEPLALRAVPEGTHPTWPHRVRCASVQALIDRAAQTCV